MINVIMEVLNEFEMVQLLGGGYWVLDSTGQWIYIADEEESEDDDVFIAK
jgi:hypothetical protein